MKKKEATIKHYKGDQAYFIRWLVYYDCRVKIDTIKALEESLEVLITESGAVMAWRFDHPENMRVFIIGEGEWTPSDINIDNWLSKE